MTRPRPLHLVALAVPLVVGAALLAPAGASTGADVLDELADYPRPVLDPAALADGVEAFSEANPLRITATPTQLQAVEQLAAEARSLGLAAEARSFDGVLTALVVTKPGTDRADEVIAFGAHLDSMVTTVHGAYDNASGVRTVMALAAAFADVPTHRTLEFHFYNGEEEGTLASGRIAQDYADRGRQVSAYLGFDMVGIAWPVGGPTSTRNCLCMWRGARDEAFDDLLRAVNFDFLGFPEDRRLVSVEGRNVRNSDEASWADEGFRTLRWAGLRAAADYPEYHMPRDDMATIEQVAGGREYFGEGLANTVLSAYYTAAALDLEGVPAPAPAEVAPGQETASRARLHAPGDGHSH